MRQLPKVTPTAEQLKIFGRNPQGLLIIRGAAGSGKTTTAILKLKSLIESFKSRKERQDIQEPVRILALTFNRTLRGYINDLILDQVEQGPDIDLTVSTFSRWATEVLNWPKIIGDHDRGDFLWQKGFRLGLARSFFLDEIDYATGRFLPDDINQYLDCRRDGRGTSPPVVKQLREKLINDVIIPYNSMKAEKGLSDWNDLAIQLSLNKIQHSFDVIIADEVQDFSANQIRAINNQLSEVHSLTFVTDTAQRIYARGFSWQEVGLMVRPENIIRLSVNYRNTLEIAKFALALLKGIPFDTDATMPNFNRCVRRGPIPTVLKGRFKSQVTYVINYINENIDIETESVAVLHPLGGGWFNFTKNEFKNANLKYIDITRESEWPSGDENIAFSTMSSSKGLEFDHVVIIGLNSEVTRHGDTDDDDKLLLLRRLLAMSIGRAKKSVVIGCKPQDSSKLFDYLDPATYQEVMI
ncbi:Superfamily I DNA and RNA helicase-like protein [Desulfatibacillum aliphaticivorans]|uniref:Superfamily I DNA and RNA helicase-like protein n=1 Tax=Desulfatibacillum aliphaticivorans TaxID=218208 RepID=B8FA55_DESAL|nr:UvrD-helicase domain-containing protein [Desulfatibacillum aliphaticivorans]ACL03151.1 Superfamily I DNA and RNA helicase-like protein [Desulfatibacillum aliphaticivorans]